MTHQTSASHLKNGHSSTHLSVVLGADQVCEDKKTYCGQAALVYAYDTTIKEEDVKLALHGCHLQLHS